MELGSSDMLPILLASYLFSMLGLSLFLTLNIGTLSCFARVIVWMYTIHKPKKL